MAAQTRLWRELPYTQAMRGHGETRERRSWAILDGRHRSATLPFVAHYNCIGFLYSARPGYRPHLPYPHNGALFYGLSCDRASCINRESRAELSSP